jgi:hypothetical protein
MVAGQTARLEVGLAMSALPPKADMDQHGCDVRFVPKADVDPAEFLESLRPHNQNNTAQGRE